MTFGCKLKISQDAAKEAVHPHGEQEPPSLTHLGRSINMDVYLISCQLHHILGDVLEAFYMARNNFLTRGQSDASPESSPRAAMTPKVLASLFQIEASLCKWRNGLNSIIRSAPNQDDHGNVTPIIRQTNILHARSVTYVFPLQFFSC